MSARWLAPLGLLLFGLALFLPGLSTRALWHPDETRYAEIPREILVGGDWIVPHLDTVPYLDKPPLLYWLTAFAYRLGGVSEAMARIVSVVSALVILFCTYLLGARGWGVAAGVRAAVICATSALFLVLGRWALTDVLLTACTTATLTAWWFGMEALEAGSRSGMRRGFWIAGFFAGLGVLTKGPAGVVLPGLVVVSTLIVDGRWRRWREMPLIGAAGVCLAVSAPWFVLAQQQCPDFFEHFFIGQNLGGFQGSTRVHHPGRWYTYFVYLPLIWFPWSALLPSTVGAALRAWRGGDRRVRFLVCWALSIFIFFTICGSKLPTYLLPIYPALALLTALLFDPKALTPPSEACHSEGTAVPEESRPRGSRPILLSLAALGIVGALVPAALFGIPAVSEALRKSEAAVFEPALRPLAPWVAAICLAGAGGAMAAWERRRFLALGWLVAMMIALTRLAGTMMEAAEPIFSSRALVQRLEPRLQPGDVVASYEMSDHAIAFYLRRPYLLVGKPGELDIRTEEADPVRRNDPGNVFRTREEFDVLCRGPGRVYCFVSEKDLDEFRRSITAPMSELDQSGPKRLFVNHRD